MNAIFGDSNAVQKTAFDTPLNFVRNSLNISILAPPLADIYTFCSISIGHFARLVASTFGRKFIRPLLLCGLFSRRRKVNLLHKVNWQTLKTPYVI